MERKSQVSQYLCVHLHFYQPPRENAWSGEIERQESAAPYHNWNERIAAECYRPNGEPLNHYGWTSFNFGPTLLSWLEAKDAQTYEAVLEGDRQSQRRFGGHGSAIAQAYNHLILPLANRRDKETQVIWGSQDFQKRFLREPESLWLPETAVDVETLEILVDHGMKYVILAPHQGKEVEGGPIETRQAYWIQLPSGRPLAAFFYDGSLSHAVAFEGLLRSGPAFEERLRGAFCPNDQDPQLVHLATDGETYGHHQRQGEKALSHVIHSFQQEGGPILTNYGQYLELHPPVRECILLSDSSWSCAHGVERWRSNCGCQTGQNPHWNQEWRGPLRAVLDEIRDELSGLYEVAMRERGRDPWQARNGFLGGSTIPLSDPLLEMQRYLLFMYTSCGWFFDDITGIETVQNIQYAERALSLAEEAFSIQVKGRYLEKLRNIPSNVVK